MRLARARTASRPGATSSCSAAISTRLVQTSRACARPRIPNLCTRRARRCAARGPSSRHRSPCHSAVSIELGEVGSDRTRATPCPRSTPFSNTSPGSQTRSSASTRGGSLGGPRAAAPRPPAPAPCQGQTVLHMPHSRCDRAPPAPFKPSPARRRPPPRARASAVRPPVQTLARPPPPTPPPPAPVARLRARARPRAMRRPSPACMHANLAAEIVCV